jgi:hypothetical protein
MAVDGQGKGKHWKPDVCRQADTDAVDLGQPYQGMKAQ